MELEKQICPYCKSENVAAIMYGLPYFTDELKDELKNGRVFLGGCCVTNDDPIFHCNNCGKNFGSPEEPESGKQ